VGQGEGKKKKKKRLQLESAPVISKLKRGALIESNTRGWGERHLQCHLPPYSRRKKEKTRPKRGRQTGCKGVDPLTLGARIKVVSMTAQCHSESFSVASSYGGRVATPQREGRKAEREDGKPKEELIHHGEFWKGRWEDNQK